METIKIAIFDMDGLMIDSEKVYTKCGLITSEKYNYGITEELLNSVKGTNIVQSKEMFLKALGEDFDYMLYRAQRAEIIEEYVKEHPMEVKPGLFELLNFFKENNISLCVATASPPKNAHRYLDPLGITPYFEHFVYGSECKLGKPDPEIFLKAADHFNMDPKYCVVFEDSRNGLKAAVNAGMRCFVVPDICPIPEDEKKTAYKVLNKLDDAIPYLKEMI